MTPHYEVQSPPPDHDEGRRRSAMAKLRTIVPLVPIALVLTFGAPRPAEALCTFGKCRNAVWAPGAQGTAFGGISKGARLTPFGVTNGKQTAYGVTSGYQTPFGVTDGHLTPFGVSAGHQTAYGVSAGHQTAFGATSGKETSFGVVGAGCQRTPFGYVCSDMRLKRDIAPIGQLPDGLEPYRYRYLWSDQMYVGVMAQEVAAIEPAAVVRGADGYLRVSYARLGLRLQTWQQWRAAH
jgi:hypothetical protein